MHAFWKKLLPNQSGDSFSQLKVFELNHLINQHIKHCSLKNVTFLFNPRFAPRLPVTSSAEAAAKTQALRRESSAVIMWNFLFLRLAS